MLWNYFSEGTMVGMTSLISKANLITKVKISKWTIVLASIINASITFLINLLILATFFALYRISPSLSSIILGLVFFILIYTLIVGFSLITAPLFLKYRDLNQIWEVLLTLGFYASPIIYPLSLIPLKYQPYLWINPMSYLIHYTKLALVDGQLISLDRMILLVMIIVVILCIGMVVFNKMHNKVAELI